MYTTEGILWFLKRMIAAAMEKRFPVNTVKKSHIPLRRRSFVNQCVQMWFKEIKYRSLINYTRLPPYFSVKNDHALKISVIGKLLLQPSAYVPSNVVDEERRIQKIK